MARRVPEPLTTPTRPLNEKVSPGRSSAPESRLTASAKRGADRRRHRDREAGDRLLHAELLGVRGGEGGLGLRRLLHRHRAGGALGGDTPEERRGDPGLVVAPAGDRLHHGGRAVLQRDRRVDRRGVLRSRVDQRGEAGGVDVEGERAVLVDEAEQVGVLPRRERHLRAREGQRHRAGHGGVGDRREGVVEIGLVHVGLGEQQRQPYRRLARRVAVDQCHPGVVLVDLDAVLGLGEGDLASGERDACVAGGWPASASSASSSASSLR